MASFSIKIESALGGIAPTLFQGRKDQFMTSLGVDPDYPIDISSGVKTSGAIVPTSYGKFSSSGMTAQSNWLVTCPQGDSLYSYLSDGNFLVYDSTLSSEIVLGKPTSGAGNGAAYYNNYVYTATPTDISRFGPLDAAGPAFANTFWTGTLGKTQMQNSSYPGTYPNHPMHVHNDGSLYIGDYDSGSATAAYRGNGLIHQIKTQFGGGISGSADNGSVYAALILPPGMMPVDIESFGTDLVIAAISAGNSGTFQQGKGYLFFWDTINRPGVVGGWYRAVPLPDPTVTALLNSNGKLHIFSGNNNAGVRVSTYTGDYTTDQIAFFEEGNPPPAGAVDAIGDRIIWGATTTYPSASASVYAYGYKNSKMPKALHNIIKTTSVGTNPKITALKYTQLASFIVPRAVVGWTDNSGSGLDKLSTAAGYTGTYRSLIYQMGQPFKVTSVTLPFSQAVAANMNVVATIYVDDGSSSQALLTVNNTNFTGVRRAKLEGPTCNLPVIGADNFFLDLTWSGTSQLPVTYPIIISGDYLPDSTRTNASS